MRMTIIIITTTMDTIKICLIAIAKNEEQFIDEWINYHLNLGFDHIIICDNNDINNPLNISNAKVEIRDFRGIDFSKHGYSKSNSIQIDIYNEIIKDVQNKFEYCGICDIDEFFDFKGLNIQDFISYKLSDCDCVEIPWEVYDDNDLIFHIDKPVQELYPHIQNKIAFNWEKNECSWGKSIFKLNNKVRVNCHKVLDVKSKILNKKEAVVKHYRTRCLEDYIKQKCNLRHANKTNFTKGNIIQTYFMFNNINLDKLLWSLKFCHDCNLQLTVSDRIWVMEQFNKYIPITIVIRTYNRLESLKECLQNTINKQTYNCKVLVLNDGSTDGTKEWLAQQNYDFLSLEENVGPGEILARGKYLITTPYYLMLDDDDVWTSSHVLEFFYNMIIDNPYFDVIHTGYNHHCSCVIKTELLLKCPNLSLRTKDDYYFIWIKINSKTYIKARFDFYTYRRNLPLDYHVNQIDSSLPPLAYSFFRSTNIDSIKEHMQQYYHTYSLEDRKILDQMLNYIEISKL